MRWILLFATTFAFVVLACEYGRAAEIMDRVVQCNRIAMGAGARVQGFQGRMEWVSKEQVQKYQAEDYKGGMYILDEGETPEDRAKFDDPIMYGWKMEDDHIQKHAGQMKDPRVILEACMKQQDS